MLLNLESYVSVIKLCQIWYVDGHDIIILNVWSYLTFLSSLNCSSLWFILLANALKKQLLNVLNILEILANSILFVS